MSFFFLPKFPEQSEPQVNNKQKVLFTQDTLSHRCIATVCKGIAEQEKTIAVCVSGGADSLLLLKAMVDWAMPFGVAIHAVTVDHGLRPEAKTEAAHVKHLSHAWGASHQTITLNLPPNSSQAKARNARYNALALHLHTQRISIAALGHHQDDQLETFIMRLKKGSGSWGLGGMTAMSERLGLRWLRPFLALNKDQILEEVQHHNIPFLQDPSNTNTRFERVRLRHRLSNLPPHEKDFWFKEIHRYQQKRKGIQEQGRRILQESCLVWSPGMITLNLEKFLKCGSTHPAAARFALQTALSIMGGHTTRLLTPARIQHFWESMRTQQQGRSAFRCTLGGCHITIGRNTLQIAREWQRIVPHFLRSDTKAFLWDKRFLLEVCPKCQNDAPLWIGPQGYLEGKDMAQASLPQLYTIDPCTFRNLSSLTEKEIFFKENRWLFEKCYE
jgi:tRNA(Ile)-lysidine synthase